MPVSLRFCKVHTTVVPIGYDDSVIVPLASKLAKGETLSLLDMSNVNGFRFALSAQTRRTTDASKRKAFLIYRVVLAKDGRPLKQIEVMDQLAAKTETVIDHTLTIPKTVRNRLGEWSVKVGFWAMYEDEMVPTMIPQMIESMPYVYTDENQITFIVDNNTALPTGERRSRIDVYSEIRSGQTSPEDI